MKGVDIPVDQIKPSPYQPRLTFDLEDIKGSIMRDGILVPLTVRKKDGYYELIDGERRWRVAKELGYKTVPCDVVEIDDDTARRMVWKVNTLRKDYTTKEKAYYFKTLQEKYGMSIRGIARECDYHPNAVLAYLNIFKLPEKYQEMVWNGQLSVSHIQELESFFVMLDEGVLTSTEITKLLDQAITQKLTVDEFRELVRPKAKEIEEEVRRKRIEVAKKALPEVMPEVKAPETPEELEKVAKALIEEAQKRKTPEQILKEKMEKVENALFSGKRNIALMIARAKELGIDTKWMEEEVEKIKNKMKFAPDDALTECKNLRKQIGDLIKKAEEKRKEEEIEKKLREKIVKEVEERTVQRMLTTPEYLEVAKSIPTPLAKTIEEARIPPEEAEAIKKRYEELKKRLDEIANLPEVKARGELFRNWYSHYAIAQSLSDAFCPACGRDKSGRLVWSCCGLDVKEAWKMAGDKFEASQKKKD